MNTNTHSHTNAVAHADTDITANSSTPELAKELRRKLSSSASVHERTGSESSKKVLWSVQVQGKYTDQISSFLKTRGITQIKTQGKAKGKGKGRK